MGGHTPSQTVNEKVEDALKPFGETIDALKEQFP
jgi:hypothetical protein